MGYSLRDIAASPYPSDSKRISKEEGKKKK